MILLQAHNISKSYGVLPILTNIQLEIRSGERIGLVGVNGAGKSTLLKIITGELSYNSGEIMKSKEVEIGYLAQNSGLESSLSIWDEMKKVFASLIEQEKALREMEQKMADPTIMDQSSLYEKLLEEYSRRSVEFKEQGGYQYEALIRNVLHGLRFAQKDYNDPISSLSGGQKTRLALAKLLLQQPAILILDEPTNYLDLETLAWLEQFLQSYPGGLLIVSHDRYFLDALVNVIYEIERTKATKYGGNYSRFLEQKAERFEQELKLFKKQQKEIEKLEDFVQRNMARASTTKRAQSRQKQLERMEKVDRPQGDLKSASFAFGIEKQSGNDVLKLMDVGVGYPEQAPLAQHIQFEVYRGDSIAIVGPNGVGKTTLLKTIMGEIEAKEGTIQKGANVTIAYYDQEQNKLRSNKTVLQEIWDDYPHMLEKEVRGLLGQFLFSGDDVLKLVSDLSGGEKARLSLAKLLLQKANVLILDEPTNHLDIYSKEVLEEALLDYPGTLLFVSHDRYFLNRMATKVVEISASGSEMYLGDYDYYVHKKKELEEIKSLKLKEASQKNALSPEPIKEQKDKESYEREKEKQKQQRQRERKKAQLEESIEKHEQQIKELEEALCLPEIYQDYEKSAEIQGNLDSLKAELDQFIEEWTFLEEE
ncbi:ABC-F family ATP-binding cassette domain-containing protein [Caldalkalibacillus mannanilyticus]|uniref:ABC-F family ATP-binding cassette domain-containing protein n=1 Tax=Caldalkalibacillus mannanilyticus TaxID=1418 RepID=UPI00046A6B8F|nr:ABC-F family ATP-binding cassette domain-containing protein [Caldalkalibacillus mannanilyticus]